MLSEYRPIPLKASDIPAAPLHYLCDQLDAQPSGIDRYEWTGRTGRRHRLEIQQFLRVRRVTKADKTAASDWLVADVLPACNEKENLEERLVEWFHCRHIEFPASKEIEKLIVFSTNEFERRLFISIADSLSSVAKEKFDGLIEDNSPVLSYTELKSEPGRLSLDSILSESKKLRFLNSLAVDENLMKRVHLKVLNRYRQRVATENAWEVRRHPDHVRYALLAMLCYQRRREVIDGLIELFCHVVHRLGARAKKKVVKELLRDFQKVNSKHTLLFKIAEASLANPTDQVNEVIYPIAGETTLTNLVKEYKASGSGYKSRCIR